MKHYKFKTSSPIPIAKLLTEYILQTNGQSALTSHITSFLSKLQQNYTPLSNLEESSRSVTFLSDAVQSSINCLSLLEMLLSKMPPSHDISFHFNFNWSDAISSKKCSSNNIWFEYFSIMYNVGVIYYSLAENILYQNQFAFVNESQSTKVRMNFASAMYYFNKVKDEIGSKLSSEEKGIDLSIEGLEYMMHLCRMGAYIGLVNTSYAKFKQYEKDFDFENTAIQNKLLQNLNQRLSITNEISIHAENALAFLQSAHINKHVDVNVIHYLQFQKDYYKSLIEYFQYEYHNILHECLGNHLGYAITFLKKSVNMRKALSETIPQLGSLIASNIFKLNLDEDDKKLALMIQQNQILRTPTVPPVSSIERTSLKIEPINPQNNCNISDINENCLSSMIEPDLVKRMSDTGNEIKTYFMEQLQQFSSEEDINAKLNSLKYPFCVCVHFKKYTIDDVIKQNESIWNKIAFAQKWNCIKGIENVFNDINMRSNKIVSLLVGAKQLLIKEKENDEYYRKMFGDIKWSIPPSTSENYSFHIEQQINEMQMCQEKNSKLENQFKNEISSLNELCIPIETVKLKVPDFECDDSIFTTEEKKIISLYERITYLKERNKELINSLQNDVVNVEQFISLYNSSIKMNSLNDIQFVAQQKEKLDNVIKNELLPNENEINQKYKELVLLCEQVISSESEKEQIIRMNSPNKKFFDNYEIMLTKYFHFLKQALKLTHFMVEKSNEKFQGLNAIYQYLNERDSNKKFLLKFHLQQQNIDPPFTIAMLPMETLNPEFKQVFNEMFELGIDVKSLKDKFCSSNDSK